MTTAVTRLRLIQKLRVEGACGADVSNVDLCYTNLRGARLQQGDFQGTDFRYADLRGANLGEADLRGANLLHADLRQTILTHACIDETTQIDEKWLLVWQLVNGKYDQCDIRDADLSDANLNGLDLSELDCRGTNFNAADMRQVKLIGADLRGASILYVRAPETVDLHNAQIDTNTKLDPVAELIWRIVNGQTPPADLSGLVLSGVQLQYANLRQTRLQGCNLAQSKLNHADLREADLSGTDLSSADLSNADLRDVILTGAVLRGAKLCGADLRGAILTHVEWQGVCYDHQTQWPEGAAPVDPGVNLEESSSCLLDFRDYSMCHSNL